MLIKKNTGTTDIQKVNMYTVYVQVYSFNLGLKGMHFNYQEIII